jgi:hypothetical protein
LVSADPDAIFSWNAAYEYEIVEYSDNLEDTLERASLDAGYRLTQEFSIVGLVGTEDNEFQRNSTDTVNGAYWNAGFRWQPTIQNSLELRAGKRDFGDVVAFNWAYTGSQLRLDAGYSEDVTTTATLILNRDAIAVGDDGAPVLNPGNPDLTGGAFVSKRFTSGVGYQLANTSFAFGAFHQDREYLDNQGDEESTGARIDIVSTVSARTDINIGAEFRDETLRILDSPVRDFEDAQTWVVEAAWIRTLGRNLGLRISVAHREAKFSGGDEGDYDEDRVALQLIWNTRPDRTELQ